MLLITKDCDMEDCSGSVAFRFEQRTRKPARSRGRCDECGTAYSLYGGMMQRAEGAAADVVASSEPTAAVG